MFDIERWQEIFDTIRKNKLRTFLTGLSVASGIFILVILLGFGQGMQNGIAEEFKEDAATSIWVWPRRTTIEYKGLNPGRQIQLRNENYESITTAYISDYEKASMLYFPRDVQMVYKNDLLVYNVAGTNGNLQTIENEFLSEGRYINETDVKENAKVAVISNKIKREVFADLETPIGEYLMISGAGFRIVGVFGEYGKNENEEERIFIPITTAQLAFNGSDKLNNINFTLPEMASFDETVAKNTKFTDELLAYLKKEHDVAPEDDRAIRIWNPIQEAKRFYSLGTAIEIFFWGVGFFTIIAGVVSVSNIMLIVVKERTREIGIRKALGAKPWSIIGMIMHEAIFVTAIAGFTGLIFSMGLLELVGPEIEVDYVLNPSVNFNVALSTVILLIVAGALAGFFPAWKAVRVQVIEALRDE
ncbi:MAG: ABC transporter permease [Maribacter sp.]